MSDSIHQLTQELQAFREARGWHNSPGTNPKTMTIALVGEVAELLREFEWTTDETLREHIERNHASIRDEVADVAIYLFELAHDLEIDLAAAIREKMGKNAQKYPIKKAPEGSGA